MLAVVTYFYLTDLPAGATWLADDERAWLDWAAAGGTGPARSGAHIRRCGRRCSISGCWALSIVYFGAVAGLYGVGFWLPQIVKAFGLTNSPPAAWWPSPMWSAARGDGAVWAVGPTAGCSARTHTAIALAIVAVGIVAATLTGNPTLTMLAFTVGSCGVFMACR